MFKPTSYLLPFHDQTDFSIPNLKPASPEWDSVRAQVRTALEEYGCFEALFNGASVELRKALFEASEEFFDLPLETKLRTKSDKLYKGYAGQNSTLPLYEAIGCDGANNPQIVDELTYKLWPQGKITFSKNVQSFAENLIALIRREGEDDDHGEFRSREIRRGAP
uniref:Non-haem dioxygenase N-terminal domain-containing protein n=1 Tax=Brassica oleracea var. oleracea TaxID=109376 RepID=A0A0D3ADP4_BRAOL